MNKKKIAFWSNTHGLSCNTTHLGFISIWYALQHPDAHCAILENHKTPCGIDRMLYRPLASERAWFFRSGGLGALLRRMEDTELSLLDLEFMAERFIGERLIYFPIGADLGPEQLNYHLEQNLRPLFSVLEKRMDHVWLDTSPSAGTTRAILHEADGVIVSISQNQIVLEHLFKNHSELHKKAFYLIGNYEEDSDLTRDVIVREFHVPEDRIAVIPRDVGIMDAVSRGTLIPYIMQCYHSEIHEDVYPVARAMREAADAVFRWIGKEESVYVYETDRLPTHTARVADGGAGGYAAHSGRRAGVLCEGVGV